MENKEELIKELSFYVKDQVLRSSNISPRYILYLCEKYGLEINYIDRFGSVIPDNTLDFLLAEIYQRLSSVLEIEAKEIISKSIENLIR